MRETLKKPTGEIIGYIDDEGARRVLKDRTGRRLGTYDTRTDETKDPTGRIIGRGDQLGRLLR